MKIHANAIKMVKLADIKLNPKNRNKHPREQIERLIKIIKKTGFRRPGTISNQSGFLVCGEGRFLAAQEMGLKEMPIMFQDYASPELEFADSVADNAIDKWAELDTTGIMEDSQLFPEMDLDMMGLKEDSKDIDNTSHEVSFSASDKGHTCPKCGFEFES